MLMQVFPESYIVPERMVRATVEFYVDLEGVNTIRVEVKPTLTTLTTGFGNSVCVPIALAMITTPSVYTHELP